jgi:uncharacterized protein
MASSLLALLDDVASLLDDVAVLTKAATRKSAGVLGDDLALNAEQVTGVAPHRELPVVWAVMRGSFVNKAILVPAALVISAFLPWAVTPLLMIGGAFLCYEGAEKLAHRFLHESDEDHARKAKRLQSLADGTDLVQFEQDRIKGAVRTDFILSAEIIAITLGTVAAAALLTQVIVLTGIALLMTFGVYGFVAAVVKLDDLGLYLTRVPGSGATSAVRRRAGRAILATAPWLMKALSVAGTAAMFLVGGGILVHGIPQLHHVFEAAGTNLATAIPAIGAVLGGLAEMLANLATGLVAGALVLAAVSAIQKLRRPRPA